MEGEEEIRGALEEGKGAILATGHFGNWEIGAAALAVRGIPFDIIVQEQRNPLFDLHLNRNRRRFGLHLIKRKDAPKETEKAPEEKGEGPAPTPDDVKKVGSAGQATKAAKAVVERQVADKEKVLERVNELRDEQTALP